MSFRTNSSSATSYDYSDLNDAIDRTIWNNFVVPTSPSTPTAPPRIPSIRELEIRIKNLEAKLKLLEPFVVMMEEGGKLGHGPSS